MLLRHVYVARLVPGSRLWTRRAVQRSSTIRQPCIVRRLSSQADHASTNEALEPVNEAGDSQSSVISSSEGLADETGRRTRNRLQRPAIPPRLLSNASDQHNDLASFLAYADRTGLKQNTNVYKGTFYEYTVAEALSRLNFSLHRTGRSNDLGIDLVGHWTVPVDLSSKSPSKHVFHHLRVLVQCKATKPQPAMVRELEGAYVGAPAGWCEEDVLALLVTSDPATKGVREAVQRSRWPLCMLQITKSGDVSQFLWNDVAARAGLEGLGVTVRHGKDATKGDKVEVDGTAGPDGRLALTWLGKLWRTAN